MSTPNYWTTLRQRRISRRTMLGASAKAGVGAAGLALVGCGDDDDDAAPAAVDTSAIDAAAGDAAAAAEAASAAADAAGRAAEAAEAASALAAEAAESDDAEQAAAAAQAAADAAADAAEAARAAGDAGAAAVAQAAADAAEAAAAAAREAGAEDTAAAAAAAQAAADAAAAAAAAAGEASAAAAETAAAAVAAAEEAADAAREAAAAATMADEEDEPAAAGAPVYGGTIVRTRDFGIDGGWNPFISLTGADHGGFLKYIYDSVLGYDDNGRVQPELADSWEIPNETTYIFNFAAGRARFQDGAPVDANAMQLNMEYVQSDPDAAGNSRAQTAIATSQFEAVDELSWRMVKEQPFGPTIVGFYGNPGAGMLISPAHFETAITDPVGAGPARVVEYQDGERWLGEKWDGYWDNERVYADELDILIRPDAQGRWAAFLDGEVSYAEPPGGMTTDLQADLEADGFQVGLGIWQTWMGEWFNLNPAAEGFNMFRDPRLRKALNLSVDREAVNAVAFDGRGKASVCNTSTESWAIQPGANYYDPPDFQAAQQLRDAAGFGDGNPVSGVFLGFGTDFHRRSAQPVFNQLLERGWDLEYFDASESVVLDRFFQAGDFITACLSWESPFDPDVTMRPTMELLLKGWMYGSPEEGPGTGRASLADYPNDEVLQGFAETEDLLNVAASFAAQEDRLAPYDRLFASYGDGSADVEGHSWTYNWVQYPAGLAAQGNIGAFRLRPVDGDVDGDGYKGLWINT